MESLLNYFRRKKVEPPKLLTAIDHAEIMSRTFKALLANVPDDLADKTQSIFFEMTFPGCHRHRNPTRKQQHTITEVENG